MPLTMTAEREAFIRPLPLGSMSSMQHRHLHEAFAELDAQVAAHQETLLAYRTIEALLGVLDHSESVDEGVLIKAVNDKVSKLVTAHQETQAIARELQADKELLDWMSTQCELDLCVLKVGEAYNAVIYRVYVNDDHGNPFDATNLREALAKAKGVLPATDHAADVTR